jgi:hypothetical protein
MSIPRTKSVRVTPPITKSPGSCMRVWKDIDSSEQATAAESYVFCTLLWDLLLLSTQSKLQSDISLSETKLEAAEMLDGDLLNVVSDIEGKKDRIERLKTDMASTKHEDRIAELNIKVRSMEDKRDNLTQEIRTLSLQSDARAKLTLHQRDLTSKEREMNNM